MACDSEPERDAPLHQFNPGPILGMRIGDRAALHGDRRRVTDAFQTGAEFHQVERQELAPAARSVCARLIRKPKLHSVSALRRNCAKTFFAIGSSR